MTRKHSRDTPKPRDVGRTSGGGSLGHRQPQDVSESEPIRNQPAARAPHADDGGDPPIGSGHSNKKIAGRLDISVKTVETYKARSMEKLGLAGRADIVRFALQKGWVQDVQGRQ